MDGPHIKIYGRIRGGQGAPLSRPRRQSMPDKRRAARRREIPGLKLKSVKKTGATLLRRKPHRGGQGDTSPCMAAVSSPKIKRKPH